MFNVSLTISGLATMLVSKLVGEAFTADEVQAFVNVGGFLVGFAMTYWGRYRQGDISWWGGRKVE